MIAWVEDEQGTELDEEQLSAASLVTSTHYTMYCILFHLKYGRCKDGGGDDVAAKNSSVSAVNELAQLYISSSPPPLAYPIHCIIIIVVIVMIGVIIMNNNNGSV